jgi:hypothetical protein
LAEKLSGFLFISECAGVFVPSTTWDCPVTYGPGEHASDPASSDNRFTPSGIGTLRSAVGLALGEYSGAIPETAPNFRVPDKVLPVAIASDPAGARIEIENIESGKTPAILKLHRRVSRHPDLPGYETWQEKFTVSASNPGRWPRP